VYGLLIALVYLKRYRRFIDEIIDDDDDDDDDGRCAFVCINNEERASDMR